MDALSISVFNLELIAPECLMAEEILSFSWKMKATLLIPMFLLGFLFIFCLMNYWPIQMVKLHFQQVFFNIRYSVACYFRIPLGRTRLRIDKDELLKRQKEKFLIAVRAFNLVLSFLYIVVSQKALALFDCTQEADGEFYLDADPSLVCYRQWWYDTYPFAFAAVMCVKLSLLLMYM
ncbi:hypothetical protein BKA69DRAFT_1232 [Paraphysoderma sedebokerense]|nr:hypothetical protein BKA69DRAFT_1232 [Paraphysoderma sedebokerense]